jgi:hypothetical protein
MADTNGYFKTALQEQDTELNQMGISRLDGELDSLFSGKIDFHSMLSESIVDLAAVTRKVMSMEVAKKTIVTAIALKQYQLKHGNYPLDLNSLMPEFVAVVPLDPVDGQPLRYRPNAEGTFLLYSVGGNGVDDGGNTSLKKGGARLSFYWQNPDALDWVWPQPATAEEIQKYYAEQAKQAKN